MGDLSNLIEKYQGIKPSCHQVQRPVAPAASSDPGVILSDKPVVARELLCGRVVIIVDGKAWVEGGRLPDRMAEKIKTYFTVRNPAYKKAKRFGGTSLPEPYFCGYEVDEDGRIGIPRASLRWLIDYIQAAGATVELVDKTESAPAPDGIQLTDAGERPLGFMDLFEKRYGVYVGQGGDDRRRLAAHIIAARSERTLIVVKRITQLYQWRDALSRYTSLSPVKIGLIGDNHNDVDAPVVVAIDRSLWKRIGDLPPVGQVVIDRCDTANMKIFYQVAWRFPARYLLGLAAADRRHDGLTRMMVAFCGPVRFVQPVEMPLPEHRPVVEIRPAPKRDYGQIIEYDKAVSVLLDDDERTELVSRDVLQLAAAGASVLVVSLRIEHLEKMRAFIENQYHRAEIVSGRTGANRAAKLVDAFNSSELPVLLTTTKTIVDLELTARPGICAVVAAPFKYRDTASSITHCLGKGTASTAPGRLVEYSDNCVFFQHALDFRIKTYKQLGARTPVK